MQTILGANGVIATELARALTRYTDDIRLVSRHPRKVNDTDQTKAADLTDPEQTLAAVEGAEVVYLTVGLPYKAAVWEERWPIVMRNTIQACAKHDARLVFFDNVYMYGKVDGWMNEQTPIKPVSKKGRVRAKILQMLCDEVEHAKLSALVARSADFYGKTPLSVVSALVFDRHAQGKRAQILIDAERKHSYTFIPDAGEATALLGNTPDAFNQVWHLPTDSNVLTGSEFVEESARAFGAPAGYTVLNKWLLSIVGVFNSVVREGLEMSYQNEYDYLFSSDKFDTRFQFTTTSYQQGIKETARAYLR